MPSAAVNTHRMSLRLPFILLILVLATLHAPMSQALPHKLHGSRGNEVLENIAKIRQLLKEGKGKELQCFMENIGNLRNVWYTMERQLILDILSTVPQPDEMMQKFDADIIASIFTNFSSEPKLFEQLKALLPKSYKMVAASYEIPQSTSTTPSCGATDPSVTVDEQISKIRELVKCGKGEELQNYLENMPNFRAVWFAMERQLILDIISIVPQPDEMMLKFDVDVIGSLFINFMNQPDVYEQLMVRLPKSYQIALANYPILQDKTTTSTSTCSPVTTATTSTAATTTISSTTTPTTTTTTAAPVTTVTTTTTPITTTTSTITTTTMAQTTTSTPSCGCGGYATAPQHIRKIKELIQSGRGQELQNYVECIANFRDVWFDIDRFVVLDMIFLVPQADQMVKKWDVDIIGSLFTTFMEQTNTYERLKALLPQSFQIAAYNYAVFRSAATESTSTTTTTHPIPTTTTTTTSLPPPAAMTTTPASSCNKEKSPVVAQHIARIKELLNRGQPEDLQNYMESISDMCGVWWNSDVYFMLKVITRVPRPDAMVRKWPQEAIGSLFTTFISLPCTYAHLRSILPQSFAIAQRNYNLNLSVAPSCKNCPFTCA